MKILLLDIETSPNTAHVWGLWQQNVSINQLMESSYVMCWAAKWLDKKEVMFDSVYESKPKEMIKKIHALIDEADAIIHYNGSKFDIPTLNKEFLLYGLPPPSPVKQIDLLQTSRHKFKFPSNKLDYVAQALGVGAKVKHIGHELWIRCMNKDAEAWAMMKKYNKHDVVILERVYAKMLGWISNHPNRNAHDANSCCTNCGSSKIHHRGYSVLTSGKYRRMQCQDCGTWFRSNKKEQSDKSEKFVKV